MIAILKSYSTHSSNELQILKKEHNYENPVDLTFTCAPGGVAEGKALDNSTVKISDQITRKGLTGGFGCPESKSDGIIPGKI